MPYSVSAVQQELANTLQAIDTPRPDYRGKVRDIFTKGAELFIVATDRISAFDCVLGTVPFKGAMLTKQARVGLEMGQDIVPTHYLECVDPQVMRCKKAKPFKFEMIIRGYLTGSLLRESADVRGNGYGLQIDPNVPAHGAFPTPIITPSTKAEAGAHDEPISLAGIVEAGWATQKQLDEVCAHTRNLFEMGTQFAATQDLILVDTKYEFGIIDNKIVLIDEIHTADSSRYWIDPTGHSRPGSGSGPDCGEDQAQSPKQLDKEFFRQMLIEDGYDPKTGSTPPNICEDQQMKVCERYWELTEKLLGESFKPTEGDAATRVSRVLKDWIK